MTTNRTRTFSWEDPIKALEEAKKLNGYDYLMNVLEGNLPMAPIQKTISSRLVSVEKGQVVFELRGEEFHYNQIGTVHGGTISTILDSAIGCSLLSTLEVGESFTSLDLKVNFLRKITAESPALKTKTKIIHKGKTTAYLECELVDEEGKLYAHAVSNCMIFR
ncbi:PaaI family thioesterase [Myroides sp. N17-2]|uniref:PaaI family thioesterase n=1 Tax=Myroides sp. N17-2 TaxID=2030799 RepID=UPI000EFB4980|nr:PaaI family thioesterase [Myroides sp. N17-2]